MKERNIFMSSYAHELDIGLNLCMCGLGFLVQIIIFIFVFLFFVLLSLCTIEILNIVSIYQRIYPLSLIRINIFTEKISQRIYFYA